MAAYIDMWVMICESLSCTSSLIHRPSASWHLVVSWPQQTVSWKIRRSDIPNMVSAEPAKSVNMESTRTRLLQLSVGGLGGLGAATCSSGVEAGSER